MRVESVSVLGKLQNITELTSQQFFPKFTQLQGLSQLLKKFLSGKEKLRVLDTNGASCKVSETLVKDVEKFIETVCYSGKEVKGF